MRTTTLAPLYGPPRPMISFWLGRRYLGVTAGLPSDIEAARAKLKQAISSQLEEHVRDRELAQLNRAGAQLSCGMVVMDLT
ncbi:hypothetical protein G3A43_07090 [Paraburkholderia aspalathi]|nr:hypothetical protein [Paraburkholderia aspalathi]MBK3780017.1 hypothetical protein [Paraburkholderia aspalathi]